ncbi:hypothetical protein ACHHYP_20557 [Achlya hypogyna]|uniref:DDE-1 domain-containing protein n=1 Tax=Achlya hypogyna TaxID=1202772 RepID=A0A1V9YJ35_ACHHY|nr:hypothetical protein ACHHYP_20557 [Achlya hypogyna]
MVVDDAKIFLLLAVSQMIDFIKVEAPEWYTLYIASKRYEPLQRVCQRFAERYDFSWRRASGMQPSQADLNAKKSENATRFWACFSDIDEVSVLIVDNFKAHVSEASHRIVWEDLKSDIWALPPNTTSACQPLDVGDMGPTLRRLWAEDMCVYSTAKEKRIATIRRAIAAWDEITTDSIRSAFTKALPTNEYV